MGYCMAVNIKYIFPMLLQVQKQQHAAGAAAAAM
jgi:hypothetical protein